MDYLGLAREYIQRMRAGGANGDNPETFGPFAPAIEGLQEAHRTSGAPGVEKALAVMLRAYPDLAEMVTPPAPPKRYYSMVDMWGFQQSVQKLWGAWLLLNNITLIGGVSNVGKSPLILAMVAGYIRGVWPDGEAVPPEFAGGTILYCTPEGFAEQTQILTAWGLPIEEIRARIFSPAIPTPGAEDVPNFMFKLDASPGREVFIDYCETFRPRLVIVDGLRAAMSGDESSSADSDKFMAEMMRAAIRFNAAVIICHHLSKAGGRDSADGQKPSIDWFRGSGHLLSVPRAAWIVDRPDDTNELDRRITLVKAATGASGQQKAFRMGDPERGLTFISSIPRPPAKTKGDKARQWVLKTLRSKGLLSFEEMLEEAEGNGEEFSPATLKNARVGLSKEGLISSIIRDGRTLWGLTEREPSPPPPPPPPTSDGAFQDIFDIWGE